jgi:UPF0755 protein
VRSALRILSLFLAAGLAFGGILLWGYAQYVRPGPLTEAKTLVIPQGTGLESIAALLARNGVIVDQRVFIWGSRAEGLAAGLKAGEYSFPAAISTREAALLLRSGKTVVRRFTVAEGLTTAQILRELATAEGLMGEAGGAPDEGSLLPETYHYSYGDRRAAMLSRMRDGMTQALAKLWAERADGLPLRSPREALVLASIVEKETGIAAERPLIAGVFINRLKMNMRLQSDPTVVYGLTKEGALDRALTSADLRSATPFNTYMIDGLPPSPICNPGLAALAAVLHPAQTDALYFVADGTGGHAFAKTLAEHQRNVARWRRIQGGAAPPPTP